MDLLASHSHGGPPQASAYMSHTPTDPSTNLPARAKGCRTCRIRRIKCDKTFPVCKKCTSTGRQCDGYGIWGGGPQAKSASLIPAKTILPAQDRVADVRHISTLTVSSRDLATLEWFQHRLLTKTPGMFKSEFWDTLVLQASATEPAIMQSILALSSVHRWGVTSEVITLMHKEHAARYQTAALRHYVQAISQLRGRVLSQGVDNKFNLRIVLITCLVFVCVELLRGEIDSAQNHLRSGLTLLREAGWFSIHNEQTVQTLKSSEAVDHWIAEVFGRFHLHNEMWDLFFLNRPSAHGMLSNGGTPLSRTEFPSCFSCMEDAWVCVDRILLGAIYLTQDCKSALRMKRNPASDQLLISRRTQLQAELTQWLNVFDKSRGATFKTARVWYDQSLALIDISFNLATVLTETSLFVDDETIYDQHIDTFRRLLDPTAEMVHIYQSESKRQALVSPRMSFTTFDIFSLPTLYFTVTKCRDVEVRRRGLARLGVLRQRECYWDGWLTDTVAKKVVELEQGSLDVGSRPDGTSDVGIPASSRLHNLRISTLGDPFAKLFLDFERAGVAQRLVLDVQSGLWSRTAHGSDSTMRQ